jgi:hypothetical protein
LKKIVEPTSLSIVLKVGVKFVCLHLQDSVGTTEQLRGAILLVVALATRHLDWVDRACCRERV